MNWYYAHRIGIEIRNFWNSIFTILPAFAAPVVAGVCIMHFVTIENFIQLILWAALYTLVFFISMWYLGMNESERKIILDAEKKLGRKTK